MTTDLIYYSLSRWRLLNISSEGGQVCGFIEDFKEYKINFTYSKN